MEEPQKKPERETESKPATATAPALSHSQGNSFICVASSAVAVAVGASLALCHCCTSLIMRAALGECDARIAGEQNGWAQATGKRHRHIHIQCSSHRHHLRHDKVVICWQLKVLLIVQLIDVIN